MLGGFAAQALAQTAPGSGNPSNPGSLNFSLPPSSSAAHAPGSTNGPDIRDIQGLAPLTFWERNGATVGYGSGGGIVLLALLVWFLLRKKPARPLTPYESALRELDFARALSGDGQHQVFAIAASDAVRHYLENAYQMPAPERTTEEFLQEAARHAWLQGELAGRLRHFLELCDLAKFAGQELGTTEREQLLGAAREFIDAAEKRRQPPPTATPGAQKAPPPATPPAATPPAEPSLTAP